MILFCSSGLIRGRLHPSFEAVLKATRLALFSYVGPSILSQSCLRADILIHFVGMLLTARVEQSRVQFSSVTRDLYDQCITSN